MKFKIWMFILIVSIYSSIFVESKLFAPNESEFDDDPDDEGYTAVNRTKIKLSKQNKLMKKYMKTNSKALEIEMVKEHGEYMHVAGNPILFTCKFDPDVVAEMEKHNQSKVEIDWRKDVLDFYETEDNFRLIVYDNGARVVINPAIAYDSGYYQCVIGNTVVGSATVDVPPLGEAIGEGLICMLVLSASGFMPFVLAIIIRHFFMGKRITLMELERNAYLRKFKEKEPSLYEFQDPDEKKQLQQVVSDNYLLVYGKRPKGE